MNVLVTGSSGLVGRELCFVLERAGHLVTRVVRRATRPCEIAAGDINGITNWDALLPPKLDAVVHLAARVHVMHGESDTSVALYRDINAEGTRNLAWKCANKGVKRFVYVSTVKVLGEGRDLAYRHDDPPHPYGAYAESKWQAEQYLCEIAVQTGMEVVILRPPLVYGPGVGANFLYLLRVIDNRLPLPFGAIRNRRSLIYLGNLVDALKVCLMHPDAAGKTYLVSDGDDISTPELIRRIAFALGRQALLFPVPSNWMKFMGRLFGKQAVVERLAGSLTVDSYPIQNELDWSPPYTMQAGLAATVAWYRKIEAC